MRTKKALISLRILAQADQRLCSSTTPSQIFSRRGPMYPTGFVSMVFESTHNDLLFIAYAQILKPPLA